MNSHLSEKINVGVVKVTYYSGQGTLIYKPWWEEQDKSKRWTLIDTDGRITYRYPHFLQDILKEVYKIDVDFQARTCWDKRKDVDKKYNT